MSQKIVKNILDLFTWIFKCDAPGCKFFAVSNISEKECISKVKSTILISIFTSN